MTDAQKFKFYLPAWRRCAEANNWVMHGRPSRLQVDIEAQFEEVRQGSPESTLHGPKSPWPEPAQTEMLKVLTFAKQLSLQEARAVNAEDLRHACGMVAVETPSSKHLNNKQVNRVVTLFRLLEDPDDLDAVMDWLHPENAEKRSMVSFLRKCAPEATLVHIFRNAYGTIFWEDGDMQKLRWLAKQVKDRRTNWKRSVGVPEYRGAEVSEMNPF